MQFAYSDNFQSFANTPEHQQLKQMYPGIDDAGLWHINNIHANGARFFNSVISHWSSLDEADQLNYANIIAPWVTAVIPVSDWGQWFKALGIDVGLWATQYLLPQYGEEAMKAFIEMDLNRYLKDSILYQKTPGLTDEQRLQHRTATKRNLENYAALEWENAISDSLKADVMRYIYSEEVAEIQQAAIDARSAQNTKMIGMAIIGVFGFFLMTKAMGGSNRSAPVIVSK